MRRREFLGRAGMVAGALAIPELGSAAKKPKSQAQGKQLLELRTYHFASPEKQQAFEHFLETAAVPAFNRAGARPVGVFKLQANDNPDLKLTTEATDLWVLLPHSSFESVAHFSAALAADAVFQRAGEEVIHAPRTDPAFTRYESNLLAAFDEFPEVKVPTQAPTRILQLRIYESHNNERGRKKGRCSTKEASSRSSRAPEWPESSSAKH